MSVFNFPVFPFRVNTENGVNERLEWLTDVIARKYGKEQRRRLRRFPRRTFEYEHTVFNQKERQLFNALLFNGQTKTFGLPVWLDRIFLKDGREAVLNLGFGSLNFERHGEDFQAGGYAILYKSPIDYEVVRLAEVSEQSITFYAPTTKQWGTGTQFMPLRLALPNVELQASRFKRDFLTARLFWRCVDDTFNPNRQTAYNPVLYRGYPIFNFRNDISNAQELRFNQRAKMLDGLTGAVEVRAETFGHNTFTPYSILLQNRLQIARFLSFANERAGRLKPFWVESLDNDLTLKEFAPAGSNTVLVESSAHTSFYQSNPARRFIVIKNKNGSKIYRQIVSVEAQNENDILTLDAPLGYDLEPGSVAIGFLFFSRLESDVITIERLTDDKATVVLSFVNLLETP